MAVDTSSIGSGKTYADPEAWEADDYGSSAGNDAVGQVYGDVTDHSIWDSTEPDSVVLEAEPSAQRHDGTEGSGACLLASTWAHIIDIQTTVPCEIRWLEFDGSGDGGSGGVKVTTAASSGRHTIRHCLIYDCGSRNGIDGAVSAYVYRNVAWDSAAVGIYFTAGTVDVLACSVYSCGSDGVDFWGGVTSTCKNVASTDNTGANIDGEDTAVKNYEMDGQAANNWTDPANGDFGVKDAGSALHDTGTDLSGEGLTDIDVDIFGNTVTGTWAIGAAELVAAGGVAPTSHLYGPLVGPLGGPI
ncbi:MAG: hypothetical protein ACYTEX_25705 [Planctomycetota bacterium]|jgi:hypothetical protein